MDKHENIIRTVDAYYSEKVRLHGATPQGVDWNSETSQHLRFEQLTRVLDFNSSSSLLDYGSGFGSMFGFLDTNNWKGKYTGFDISQEMVDKGTSLYGDKAHFIRELPNEARYDYVIASGIFNVRLQHNDLDWMEYIDSTLDAMNRISTKGFSFNMLTSYSDVEFMKDYLFYASPARYFDRCKTNYSPQVALFHDYGLYEFTLIVRK
jgi:SAM-dependent methyltransferase